MHYLTTLPEHLAKFGICAIIAAIAGYAAWFVIQRWRQGYSVGPFMVGGGIILAGVATTAAVIALSVLWVIFLGLLVVALIGFVLMQVIE